MIETQFGEIIKRVDLIMRIISNSFFQKQGIVHESSFIDTHQQMGLLKEKTDIS